jgi:hypothetical protein
MQPEEIVAKQLAMNNQTWAALQKHGVTEETELRLDFSFNAPSRKATDDLYAFLIAETDYEVRIESSGSFLSRKWRLEGTTKRTRISKAILDQWVMWMVNAGTTACCQFDGWGTSV